MGSADGQRFSRNSSQILFIHQALLAGAEKKKKWKNSPDHDGCFILWSADIYPAHYSLTPVQNNPRGEVNL